MEVRAFSWNLFHGRDRPPDRTLYTWRSRLLRKTERGERYAQVNTDLYSQFAELIAGSDWNVALLQEVPPRWAERLATDCGAEPHLVLTSRNLLRPLQAAIAQLNPDLIASWEGGSNLTLTRSDGNPALAIAERRDLLLTATPERRRMAFARLAGGICVANLHASTALGLAELDVLHASSKAAEWAGGAPLIFGGDFNLRPASSPGVFARLEDRYGLTGPTADEAIDHILGRGLATIEPAAQWPAERREVADPTAREPARALAVRLSDHAPVEAVFEIGSEAQRP